MPIFLGWLKQHLDTAGVRSHIRIFDNLDLELATIGHRLAIVATGMGRSTLLNDPSIYAVRGDLIVARIPAEYTPTVYFLELADGSMSYAIPYPDLDMIKIGGTYDQVDIGQISSLRREPEPDILDGIRRRLHLSVPTLAPAILAGEYGTMTGFRPVSDQYRLTESIIADGLGRRTYRIDTDGPGGSGATIAPAIGQLVAGRAGQLLFDSLVEPAM
jgi:glycine/D-amino acid oxidase-like deaminating enzyme